MNFREELRPVGTDVVSNLASPTRLARVAASQQRDSTITDGIWDIVAEQCRLRRTVEPFFRFLDAVVSVNAPTLDRFSFHANAGF
jgi:hypothetical protein